MDRSIGEQLMSQVGVDRWWDEGAYPPDGRPSVDQAAFGLALPVALEIDPDNPWAIAGSVGDALRALGRYADRVASGPTEGDTTHRAYVALFIGDLLDRISAGGQEVALHLNAKPKGDA
jgi:hypothetical protein